MNKSMKDDSLPSGVDWLCHPKAMVAYLSLLGTSQKDSTQEASIGALQNRTAKKGPVRETGRETGRETEIASEVGVNIRPMDDSTIVSHIGWGLAGLYMSVLLSNLF